jgi:hypothetical protein
VYCINTLNKGTFYRERLSLDEGEKDCCAGGLGFHKSRPGGGVAQREGARARALRAHVCVCVCVCVYAKKEFQFA